MKLLIPLGLIALIAIPIIIIIYIIKPKYQEKRISSTYIWKLSLKYKKRKIPFSWLQRSLILLLQILSAVLMTFIIAKPIIEKRIKSAEKVIILDVSASMNANSAKDKTILDKAINEIKKDIKNVSDNSKLTIIIADDNPYYLVRRESDKELISNELSKIINTYTTCNIENAITLANEIQDENNDANVCFYTDHKYTDSGYINVTDFSDGEYNVAINNFKYNIVDGFYEFEADISSYNGSLDGKVLLDINDGFKFVTTDVLLKNNETVHLLFNDLGLASIDNVKLSIVTKDSKNISYTLIDDSFKYDNEISICDIEKDKFKVLSIGKNVTFIDSAFASLNMCSIENIDPTTGTIKNKGYNLYIYDDYYPEVLPTDGAILLINPRQSDDRLNIEVKGNQMGSFSITKCDVESPLTDNINVTNIEVNKYTVINLLSYYDVLWACENSPILLKGSYNKAQVLILGIDLHYSNLPLTKEIVLLAYNIANNMLSYTISNNNLLVNDEVTITSNLDTIKTTLDDKVIYNDSLDNLSYTTKVSTPGLHEIVQTNKDNETSMSYFFVKINDIESNFAYKGDVLASKTYAYKNISAKIDDSYEKVDIASLLALLLLIFIAIEWGLSYHEQN